MHLRKSGTDFKTAPREAAAALPSIHSNGFTGNESCAVVLITDNHEVMNPREFMGALRRAWHARIGIPATRMMPEIGVFFLRTETELILKSRRVVPQRPADAGFEFLFSDWPGAACELVDRRRKQEA